MCEKILLFVIFLIGLHNSFAFECHSCSYAYDKDSRDDDTSCVDNPELYTGWRTLTCKDYCVVQEIFNKRLNKIVAYWRSCADKPDGGFCQGDPDYGLQTCLYSCIGDLCNSWVKGQLHEVYGNVKPPDNTGDGSSRLGTNGWLILVGLGLITFLYQML